MYKFLKRAYTGLFIALFVVTTIVYLPFWLYTLIILALLSIILYDEFPRLLKNYTLEDKILFVPLYPILPFIALIALHYFNKWLTLLLFIMVFSHDVGSYIFGKLYGYHKICPAISPGKTWQGFLGGLLSTFSITLIALLYLHNTVSAAVVIFLLLFTCITSSVALLGDLFESYLKRQARIKDSGDILPGHGGLLDRLDGVLFAAIIFYIMRFKIVLYFLNN